MRRALRQTNSRHDLVAVHIEDPRERTLPDVGVVALEDAETGEVIEIDTANAAIRRRFGEEAVEARAAADLPTFAPRASTSWSCSTDAPYLPALQRFFKAVRDSRI